MNGHPPHFLVDTTGIYGAINQLAALGPKYEHGTGVAQDTVKGAQLEKEGREEEAMVISLFLLASAITNFAAEP